MPTTLAVAPASGDAQIQVGDDLTVNGFGFIAATKVTLTIPELGISEEVTSDAGGSFSNKAWAARAGAKLTVTGNAVAAETVVLGSVTYTWRASVGATANEILVGATAAESLANLAAAVNADPAQAGIKFGSATVQNADVGAGAVTATTVQFYARVGGASGNSLASTETMTLGSFAGATFAGGAAVGSVNPFNVRPGSTGALTFQATDGTNSASQHVQVWSG